MRFRRNTASEDTYFDEFSSAAVSLEIVEVAGHAYCLDAHDRLAPAGSNNAIVEHMDYVGRLIVVKVETGVNDIAIYVSKFSPGHLQGRAQPDQEAAVVTLKNLAESDSLLESAYLSSPYMQCFKP